jgi:N-acetyl sugar amidotransferase
MSKLSNYFDIKKINEPLKRCARCLCDTSISSIKFDTDGICNFCQSHDRLASEYADPNLNQIKFEELLAKVKANGKNKAYDCIVGVSGGTDSSYLLYYAKEILNLRPLAVHFDNGWNSDQAVTNIKKITDKLKIDLETVVANWVEFREIQKAFLNASVPCIETPTDVAIHGILFRAAAKEGIKYILGGQNYKTEGTVPKEWGYLDGTYIKSVVAKFSKQKLKTFPNLSLFNIFYFTFMKGIRQIPVLNFIDYDKAKAKALLSEKFGWSDYGGHHYENIYSKFAFGWYLPVKFGIDKRKISLSGPIRSGLISRENGLSQIESLASIPQDFIEYTFQKLEISPAEAVQILDRENHTYKDFHTSESILRRLRIFILLFVKLGIFPKVLYEKYIDTN